LRREPWLAYAQTHTDTHKNALVRRGAVICVIPEATAHCMQARAVACTYKNSEKQNTNINTHRVWKHSTAVFKHSTAVFKHSTAVFVTNINTHRVWKHSTTVFKHSTTVYPLPLSSSMRRGLVCTLYSSVGALCARGRRRRNWVLQPLRPQSPEVGPKNALFCFFFSVTLDTTNVTLEKKLP
jgi:hypothetical protein